MLVNTSNSANTTILELGEAMKFAGPFAAAAGESIESTAAAAAVLADRGIKASLAGTNLRGVMAALLDPTDKALSTFSRMNLTLEDLDPSTNSLIDIFKRFSDANLGAGEAVRIFGRRNAVAAVILADSVEKMEALTRANEASEGVARRNAELIEKTLSGSLKSFVSALQEAILAGGDAGFTGTLKTIVDVGTGAIRIIAGMESGLKENAAAAEILAVALKGVGAALAVLAIAKTAAFLKALALAVAATTSRVLALSAAFLASPLGAFAIGFAATTAAIRAFSDAGDDAAGSTADYSDELERATDAAMALGQANEQLRTATEEADRALQVRALEDRIDALEKLRQATIDAARAGGRVGVPEGLGLSQPPGRLNEALPFRSPPIVPVNPEDLLAPEVREFLGEIDRAIEDAAASVEIYQEKLQQAAEAERKLAEEVELAAALDDARDAVSGLVEEMSQEIFLLKIKLHEGARAAAVEEALTEVREAATEAAGRQVELSEEEARNVENLTMKRLDLVEALKEDDQARKGAERIEEHIEALREELDAVVFDRDAHRELAEAFEAEQIARKAGIELSREDREQIMQLASAIEREKEARSSAAEERERLQRLAEEEQRSRDQALRSFTEIARSIEEEKDLIGLTNDQREKAILLMEAERQLALTGLPLDQQRQALEGLSDEIDELQRMRELRDLFQDIGESAVDAFMDFATGASSARDAVRNLILEIGQMILKMMLMKALAAGMNSIFPGAGGGGGGGIGGLFGTGALLRAGSIVPFQEGGVLNGPTVFPMAGGRFGLAGEVEEALVPLKRMRSGRLGVEAGGQSKTVNVTMNVYGAKDADSFRRSRRQLTNGLRQEVSEVF